MASASLSSIVSYADSLLKTASINDFENAFNGLQVENDGQVTKIVAAVDASLSTIKLAVEQKATLMIVHHGLFWNKTHPWVGKKYQLIQNLIEHNVAVYSSHLPLDAHPKLGNNAILAAALKLKELEPFFFEKGQNIGLRANGKIKRNDLGERLNQIFGSSPISIPGGPETCKSIGIVTGGAGSSMAIAAKEEVDTFITGEGPHWSYALAEELGINVFYCGHYATETFGVKALAAHLSKKFRVPWTFVDYPTGL